MGERDCNLEPAKTRFLNRCFEIVEQAVEDKKIRMKPRGKNFFSSENAEILFPELLAFFHCAHVMNASVCSSVVLTFTFSQTFYSVSKTGGYFFH